jgi:diguanylate cyclase (GGDEF)-like protein
LVRFGGDEFVFIIIDTPNNDPLLMASKIKKQIEGENFKHNLTTFKVTCSIGISKNNRRYEMNKLFLEADNALYSAKEKGRNQIVVYDKKYANKDHFIIK